MASLEGFWGAVKNFFIHEIPRKLARKKKEREITPATPAEKRESKDRVQQIISELQRITPSHPAAEILNGVNVNDQFFKELLTNNAEFGNLIIDIIHTISIDPGQYHDPKWLQGKLKDVHGYINDINLGREYKVQAQQIANNIETLYKRSQRDKREADINNEVRRIKGGEILPDEDITTGSRYKSPAELDWHGDILDSLTAGQRGELTPLVDGLENRPANEEPTERLTKYKSLEKAINKFKKEALMHVDPHNPESFREYNKLQKAYDKLAADFTADHPREGGRLYAALEKNWGEDREKIEKRIQSDVNYRDYWFYHILENILYNHKGESHRELFGLYEHSDMQMFLEIVRRIKDEKGESVGRNMAERYDVLKNTIFQSHDMDYYCAHPQQEMKEFIGSTSLFLNSYIDAAVQDPMVSMAKRFYEQALFQIRETNDGFIPRQWLQWEEGKMRASKLDDMVEKMLKDAIKWNQLYVTKRDPILPDIPAPSVWNRKQIDFDPNHPKPYTLDELYGGKAAIDEDWRRNLGDLKIASALKQAKGLALVDMRLLEIIALSKGTGTDFVNRTVKAFNSVPYEGIVRHIEPIIHYFGRYKVGMDSYDAFFNMMVGDKANWNWDPQLMKDVVMLHTTGKQKELEDFCKKHKMGDLATRLTQAENPFSYSGMWGTKTKWRIGDSTADFDDWERDQAYAASVKLTTAGDYFSAENRKSSFQKGSSTWAYRKAQQYYIENHPQYTRLKEQYRQQLATSDDVKLKRWAELNGEEFESHWRKVGIKQKVGEKTKKRFKEKIEDKTYEDIFLEKFQKELDPINRGHPKKGSELDKLIKQLERAYKARTWVQVAMRNPLIAARELDVEWNKDGYAQKGPLRKKIIWEILHVDVDMIASHRTPKATEEAAFNLISDLEGAMAAVKEISVRNNRDLKTDDFDVITDVELRAKALEYWDMVKGAMFGDMKERVGDIYGMLGMKEFENAKLQGLRNLKIDWNVIKNIDITPDSRLKPDQFIIPQLKSALLNNSLIDRDWQHLFSTEDMGWEYLNIGALGERNAVRRAGDLGSHVEFNQLFEQYLNDIISKPKPKIEDIVELQHKMLVAMSGDFLDIGVDAVGRVAYTTGQFYRAASWTWKLPLGIGQLLSIFNDTSISQILHGRDRGDAWGPNDMLHYVQAVGSQIMPKNRYSRLGGREVASGSEWDRALLGKRLGAVKPAVAWEILNMTLAIAFLITLYRSITAKSEEEEQ